MGEKYSDGNLLDVGFGIAGGDFDDEKIMKYQIILADLDKIDSLWYTTI